MNCMVWDILFVCGGFFWPLAACFCTCKAHWWDVGCEHLVSAAFVLMSDSSWTMASDFGAHVGGIWLYK